ncbi:universal stress protein [Kineococcus sp. SYSU DK003]|uniref:universal stress protein n=1 Tax=Kineococcus sp. SYSU DK003 TaxID=3383124 RepID=UPI003D7DE050
MGAGQRTGRVVVGVADGDADRPAVDWAAEHAHHDGLALHLVHAVPETVTGDVTARWYDEDLRRYVDERAREALAEVAARVREEHPGLTVTSETVRDRPRRVLQQAAQGAALLVSGAAHRSWVRTHGFSGLLLGSTSLFLAAHAPCPVAVVRSAPAAGTRGIVVGDDGSSAARAAVGFAATRAADLAEPLRIVRTWRSTSRYAGDWDPVRIGELRSVEETAHRHDGEVLAGQVRATHPGLQVDVDVLEGVEPGPVLVEYAARARLLVVGARGHGAFATALLGSTSHDVLHRASGPVVVVPDPARVAHGAAPAAGSHAG